MYLDKSDFEFINYFTVMPKHCNYHIPMIFGGEFLAQIDIAAAMCVAAVVKNSEIATYAVTHKVKCEFLAAAQMGDIIKLTSNLVELRKKSIAIKVVAETTARNNKDSPKLVALAELVFVTKNGDIFTSHGLSI